MMHWVARMVPWIRIMAMIHIPEGMRTGVLFFSLSFSFFLVDEYLISWGCVVHLWRSLLILTVGQLFHGHIINRLTHPVIRKVDCRAGDQSGKRRRKILRLSHSSPSVGMRDAHIRTSGVSASMPMPRPWKLATNSWSWNGIRRDKGSENSAVYMQIHTKTGQHDSGWHTSGPDDSQLERVRFIDEERAAGGVACLPS